MVLVRCVMPSSQSPRDPYVPCLTSERDGGIFRSSVTPVRGKSCVSPFGSIDDGPICAGCQHAGYLGNDYQWYSSFELGTQHVDGIKLGQRRQYVDCLIILPQSHRKFFKLASCSRILRPCSSCIRLRRGYTGSRPRPIATSASSRVNFMACCLDCSSS